MASSRNRLGTVFWTDIRMINRDHFIAMLKALNFRQDLAGVWTKPFADGRFSLAADCVNGILIYPEELQVNEQNRRVNPCRDRLSQNAERWT